MPPESENERRKLSGRPKGPEGQFVPLWMGVQRFKTIMIPASPEMGSNDQPGSANIAREEPREEAPIPPTL